MSEQTTTPLEADITVRFGDMETDREAGRHAKLLEGFGLPRELAEETTEAEFVGVMSDAAKIAEERE